MPTGQKHLIQCRCILRQFKNREKPPFHKFVVFSVIDDTGNVIPKIAQCNNCGVIHKVFDITLSEIVGKENSTALISIDDLKASLPQNLVVVLEKNNADLPTWEAVQFVYENKKWGEFVVIASEADEDARQGKYVRILGENLFKVESFRREEAF
jgi:hypothetical protein